MAWPTAPARHGVALHQFLLHQPCQSLPDRRRRNAGRVDHFQDAQGPAVAEQIQQARVGSFLGSIHLSDLSAKAKCYLILRIERFLTRSYVKNA